MFLHDLVTVLSAVVAPGGIIYLLISQRNIRKDTNQLRPDHGSSLADAVHRIEINQAQQGADLREVRRFVGHEVGEVRADVRDVRDRLGRLEDE